MTKGSFVHFSGILDTPVTMITGPHSSGKSTILLHVLKEIMESIPFSDINILSTGDHEVFELIDNAPHLVCPHLNSSQQFISAMTYILETRSEKSAPRRKLLVMIDNIGPLMVHMKDELITVLRKAHQQELNVSFLITCSATSTEGLSPQLLKQVTSHIEVDTPGELLLHPNGDTVHMKLGLPDKDLVIKAVENSPQVQEFEAGLVKAILREQNLFSEISVDERYDEAVSVVRKYNVASASFLQRRMGIGYNRAANLIEQMEENNVVGPAVGANPRKIF